MSPLVTLTLKLTDNCTQTPSGGLVTPSTSAVAGVVRQIAKDFGQTLQKLNILGVRLSARSVTALCEDCRSLEQLSFEIPPKAQLVSLRLSRRETPISTTTF